MRKVCHKGKRAHSTVNHFIGQNEFIIDIFSCFITQFLAGIFMKINVLCYINRLYCRVGGIAVVLSVLVFFICLQREEGMNLL